jgi:DNA-binding NarL/FixJ family response regulator
MRKITILIADDHTLVRETWGIILNADQRFQVVAECGTGEEAVELARKHQPSVIIMDVSFPGMNGIDATEKIGRVAPTSRILGISLHTQPSYARKMIQKGAMGYLTKNSSKQEMFTAIAEITEGRKYICHEIKNILSEQMVSGEDKLGVNDLSGREMEIISFLKKGLSSKEIGDVLSISAKTVEVHRYNILKKLNLKNTAALVNFINNSQPGLG